MAPPRKTTTRKPVRRTKKATEKAIEPEVPVVESTAPSPVEEESIAPQEAPKKAPLKERMKRIPIGSRRNLVTTHEQDPNYSYRWVRDRDLRLQHYLDAGYEFVEAGESGEGKLKSANTDTRTTAPSKDNSDKLYYMRIPKEYFEEDQAEKQRRIDEIENDLKPSAERDGLTGKLEVNR